MSRDITKLHPELQDKVKKLQAVCEAKGLKIGISETIRTVAEQDALYAKGRTVAGAKVTNAKGSSYSSMHQWGVAFDFYRNDGKGAYNDSDDFFAKVGALGKSLGLEWGGDWKSLKDKPHLQLAGYGSTPAKLKKEYKTPDKFIATWTKAQNEPNTKPQSYPTVRYGSENASVGKLQTLLTEKGYKCGKVDNIFGNKTKDAVMKYQKANKLTVDGIVGPKTWEKLL